VFTSPCTLFPYIKQTRLVFKGFNMSGRFGEEKALSPAAD
jgi:hypothetical protein